MEQHKIQDAIRIIANEFSMMSKPDKKKIDAILKLSMELGDKSSIKVIATKKLHLKFEEMFDVLEKKIDTALSNVEPKIKSRQFRTSINRLNDQIENITVKIEQIFTNPEKQEMVNNLLKINKMLSIFVDNIYRPLYKGENLDNDNKETFTKTLNELKSLVYKANKNIKRLSLDTPIMGEK